MFMIISTPLTKTSTLYGAPTKTSTYEGHISPRGWRTSYLIARTKNVVSQYVASIRRDTTFFVHATRYEVLYPRREMRRSSFTRRGTTFFVCAPRYNLVPLSRRYIDDYEKHMSSKPACEREKLFFLMLILNITIHVLKK